MRSSSIAIGSYDNSLYDRVHGATVTETLIKEHLLSGRMDPGEEIALRIDQTLTQDATGTLVMLEFEALHVPRVQTKLSAQYIDHNLLQLDYKNADDHIFLKSACRKFGVWYSSAGNGVSHPVHMERFGIPGKTLLGSDSHTPAAGSLGMLAIGAGGLEVSIAMAGEPFYLKMPRVLGVKLTGELPAWVSAKDIILEMLRRYGVKGALHTVIEYYGPGLKHLSAMDRHVIANMGAEMGATSSVFPSDERVHEFLKEQGREKDFREIIAGDLPAYDDHAEIDLSTLEPLIACPSSPGNVVPVAQITGRKIYQSYIGSSANPGLRDFAIAALIVAGRRVHEDVSLDINPTSRQILENMIQEGYLEKLVRAGARIHQAGCNGCIGMGQAPATKKISLRTVPRNFPGRSGTREDQVYLCSPETAAASALTGVITDPRTLPMDYPRYRRPKKIIINTSMLIPPGEVHEETVLEKGPNIKPLPEFDQPTGRLRGPALLKVGDDISTDEIMPAGAEVLPFRSNIEEISRFVFRPVDDTFYNRSLQYQEAGFFIVAGENYGQGSSREHAALAPRYLGLHAVLAKSFARIHRQNLVNFGVVPLQFKRNDDYRRIEENDILNLPSFEESVKSSGDVYIVNESRDERYPMRHHLTARQKDMILEGGLINVVRQRLGKT